MSGGACKAAVCNRSELKSLPPGFCLETVIRELVAVGVITEAIGALENIAPRIFERAIKAIEKVQMNDADQEYMRWLLLNIYKPIGEWDELDDGTDDDDDD